MHRLALGIAALGALILAFGLAYFAVIGSEGPNVVMFYNPSQAMAPTLLAGDRFIVRPLPRRRKLDLTRGDLIIHVGGRIRRADTAESSLHQRIT